MDQNLSKDDRVVVVMGPTGSGKSTFIDCATRQDGQTIGHTLRSFTKDIGTARVEHPTHGSVVFVDTPGFDDTSNSDVEILTMIADWLMKIYKGNVNLAAIIYMHRISDNRMTGTLLKYFNMFASLCGKKAMPGVVIVTTMWNKVDADEGAQREEELKRDFWKDILVDGCRTERFDKTYESAWNIIGGVAWVEGSGPVPLLLREMVDSGQQLSETKAGITLKNELEKSIQDGKDAISRLRKQVKRHDDGVVQQLDKQIAVIEERIRQTTDQLSDMKIHQRDSIVVIMGPTGCGKSTFIDHATGQSNGIVGHGLRPYTTDVRTFRTHRTPQGSVVFIDTPGFNDPSQSDIEILSMIADFFVKTYKEKTNLTTIVYLHKIDENRMTGSILKNLQTFATLCGKSAMPNVVIATTMWAKVDTEEGIQREEELKRDFGSKMKADGCRIERFENTEESAWHIIGSLVERDWNQFSSETGETQAGVHVNDSATSKGLKVKTFTKKFLDLFSGVQVKRDLGEDVEADGLGIEHVENIHESPERIIDSLADRDQTQFQLPSELIAETSNIPAPQTHSPSSAGDYSTQIQENEGLNTGPATPSDVLVSSAEWSEVNAETEHPQPPFVGKDPPLHDATLRPLLEMTLHMVEQLNSQPPEELNGPVTTAAGGAHELEQIGSHLKKESENTVEVNGGRRINFERTNLTALDEKGHVAFENMH